MYQQAAQLQQLLLQQQQLPQLQLQPQLLLLQQLQLPHLQLQVIHVLKDGLIILQQVHLLLVNSKE